MAASPVGWLNHADNPEWQSILSIYDNASNLGSIKAFTNNINLNPTLVRTNEPVSYPIVRSCCAQAHDGSKKDRFCGRPRKQRVV